MQEFIETSGKEVANKKTLDGLILAGAMDHLGNRRQMFLGSEEMSKFSRRDERKKETNQIGLFDNSEDFKDKLELKECEEFSFEEKLL
ncbi:MAG: hypothetical protein LBF15_01210 [Candidatus Peribacteria bacterium]|nr:hypothetical protein [Candidatus Peribacteria bacterium]